MIVSMVAWDGLVALRAIRIAGEATKIPGLTLRNIDNDNEQENPSWYLEAHGTW